MADGREDYNFPFHRAVPVASVARGHTVIRRIAVQRHQARPATTLLRTGAHWRLATDGKTCVPLNNSHTTCPKASCSSTDSKQQMSSKARRACWTVKLARQSDDDIGRLSGGLAGTELVSEADNGLLDLFAGAPCETGKLLAAIALLVGGGLPLRYGRLGRIFGQFFGKSLDKPDTNSLNVRGS